MGKFVTTKEQMNKYKKVDSLIASGSSVVDAIKKVGVVRTSYYGYQVRTKRALPKKKKESKVLHIEQPRSNKVIMFVGSPEDVAAAARGML